MISLDVIDLQFENGNEKAFNALVEAVVLLV